MNNLEIIRNLVNWQYLGGDFDRFLQKHIILTLATGRFNRQSRKAYQFHAQIALK